MKTFKVGEYFYDNQPGPMREGLTLHFESSGVLLLVTLPAMIKREAKAIRNGRIDFAVFEKDGIMFLLVEIPGVLDWSDAPFHIGLYEDDRYIPDIPEGKGLGLTVIGLDAADGQIMALRLIGLGTEISREMVRIMRMQKCTPTNQVEHANRIDKIYREYSCAQMAKLATVKYTTGGGTYDR